MKLSFGFLKSPFGLLTIAAAVLSLLLLLVCCLRWNSQGDVYMQLIFAHYGWQTLIVFLLITIFILICFILFGRILHCSIVAQIGKAGVLVILTTCLLLTLVVVGIEMWLVLMHSAKYPTDQARIIAILVMAVLLSVILFFILIIVGYYRYNHFSQVSATHPVTRSG